MVHNDRITIGNKNNLTYKKTSYKNKNYKKSHNTDKKKFLTFSGFIIKSIKWLADNSKLSYKETTLVLRVANKILNIMENRGNAEAIRYTKY
jgi:hypothetical protein